MASKLVTELREPVLRGETNVEWRLQQLRILRQTLIDERPAILEALAAERGIDVAEAYLFQISPMMMDIQHYLDNTRQWSKPRAVTTDLVLQPASSKITPQPKGVVLVIAPWNYPFNLVFHPVAAALSAGNAVVMKPSELAPHCEAVIKRIASKLDQRMVRCCTGGAEVASELMHAPFDHIVYTGGERVGKLVLAAAAPNLVPVTLELGGKSPVVVAEDARLGEAAKRIMCAKFVNFGQTCIASDYVLVERSVLDETVKELVQCSRQMLGNDAARAAHVSRLANKAARERLTQYLREDHGGKIVFGGLDGGTDGGDRYVPPTIIVGPRPDSMVMTEEIFGPILPVLPVDCVDDAIDFINARPKPLALYVFGGKANAQKVLDRTSSGAVVVNDTFVHKGNTDLAFGGIGNSGMGRLHGQFGFDELSNLRGVMYRSTLVPSLYTNRYPLSSLEQKLLYHVVIRYRKAPGWLKWAAILVGAGVVVSKL